MKVIVLTPIFCMFLLVVEVSGAENIWQGINYASSGSSEMNVDDASSWSLGVVPGDGNSDTATFLFGGSAEGAVLKDMYIYSTNEFNPSAIYFHGNSGSYGWQNDKDLYLDKSLTLTNLTVKTMFPSGGSGQHNDRFRFGTKESGKVLTLAGNGEVLNVNDCFWCALHLDGDMVFTGTNLVFRGNKEGSSNISGTGKMIFSDPDATISLINQKGATIGLGEVLLFVRTNQVWNADDDAYIRISENNYTNMICSVDDGRLDNLGNLNISVLKPTNGTVDMWCRGGTYGGIRMCGSNGDTVTRDCRIKQRGDVKLMKCFPDTSYGLNIHSAGKSTMSFDTQGYDLKILGGGVTCVGYEIRPAVLTAVGGSDVYVNGDITIYSADRNAWLAGTNGVTATRALGIMGDADLQLFFTGSYSNNCRSLDGDGLYQSTVNAVGLGTNQYFEVGDSTNQFEVLSGSFGIDTLNIGVGTSNATVVLVNNFLNDNPVVVTNEVADKAGERLIVNNLNVASDSIMNVNGQSVIVTTSFSMDETAVLDLNLPYEITGVGQVITSFYGVGDQSAVWSAFEDQVVSGDGTTGFSAYYDSVDDKTYWKVSSVGGGTIMIVQ